MKVSIFTRGSNLYLNWMYQGRRYRLATGLVDNEANRKVVEGKVKLIESDLAYERLDTTLEKYGKVIKKQEPEKEQEQEQETLFYYVWLRFVNYKSKYICKNTLGKYKALSSYIHDCFNGLYPSGISTSYARGFLDYLKIKSSKRDGSLKTVQERTGYLSACWKWGIGEGWIKSELVNPFDSLGKLVKPQPKQPPKPFTREEVKAILEWFYYDYHHYYPYVKFLLNTGCRLGEAKGLLWKHVDWDAKTIWIGESMNRDRERKATKINKARTIPMNEEIAKAVRMAGYSTDLTKPAELVFTTPQGKPIDDHNFNQRVWKKCLNECGIEYRRPYNCRHTFISHCLEKGLSPTSVASITGHDVQTLYENYAGIVGKVEVPELYVI